MNQKFQVKIGVDQFVYSKEFTRLSKALKDLAEHSRRDIQKILIDQAKLFCVDLIHVTQPWGRGTKAKKVGEGAVAKDIRKVYLNEFDLYEMIKKESEESAKAFYYYLKKGDMRRAGQIASKVNIQLNSFDYGRKHKQKRSRNTGKVTSTLKNTFAENKDIIDYTNNIKKNVGFAKAGWAHAAKALGGHSKIPAWVKRHNGNLGTVRITKRGGIDEVLLINNVKYIGKLVDKYHVLKAMNSRGRAIQRLVQKVIEINANADAQRVLLAGMIAGLK
ncbi:MAG: hypothetical protein NE327_09145 [Lentisphaeraceae bacterium]|nr:hypothetical protein [Lentisphaeraceae bacterium]